MQQLGSMHDTGCLGLVHWDDQRDDTGRVQGGEHMYTRGRFMFMYDKINTIL